MMNKTYTDILRRADEWIEAHKAEYIAEIQGLARIPSVSRADLAQPGAPFGPDCRRVLDYALERGRCWQFEAEDLHGCAGSITMGDGDNAIGLIAHLDVVPVGDGWVYPPYGATYLPEHDVLIGRGVDDNKGSAVAALFAMRMLREFGWPLKHGVKLICGLSEETGMQDMKLLKEKGYRFPQLSLVPDAGFPVNYAQKGSVDAEIAAPCKGNLIRLDAGSVRNIVPDLAVCTVAADEDTVRAALSRLDDADTSMLTVRPVQGGTEISAAGRSGHAAFPQSTDNAIHRLTRALTLSGLLEGSCRDAVAQLADLTSDAFGESEGVAFSDEASGPLTLVYGVAHLKDGLLHVSADCRYSISLKGDELCARLRADWARRGYQVTRLESSDPFYIPKDDPRVQALQDVYKTITGRDDQPYAMGGGTYSRAVPNAISFGPGMPGPKTDFSAFLPEGHGGGHGRDEAIFMDKVYTCSRIYAAAIAALDAILP
ncbi:MAG: Sapep family Mn(2+)-dependent dipeptidase [Clostridia bacterium]|nr:Sapep family Mn(2+)-dependent dipeptidase [Clostridia bacterium]